MNIFVTYITSLILFLIIDGVWLSLTVSRFYSKHIGHLMSSAPNFFAAGLFYLIYILGLLVFVTNPAIISGSGLINVFVKGALFGLVAYATYDLTSQAVIKSWPTIVTVVDLIWGALLTGVVSVLTVLIIRALF